MNDAETRRIWRPLRNFQQRTLMRSDSHRCVLGRWRFSDFPRPAFSWIVSIQWDVKHVGDWAQLKSLRPLSPWISPDGKLATNSITFCLFISQVIYQTSSICWHGHISSSKISIGLSQPYKWGGAAAHHLKVTKFSTVITWALFIWYSFSTINYIYLKKVSKEVNTSPWTNSNSKYCLYARTYV